MATKQQQLLLQLSALARCITLPQQSRTYCLEAYMVLASKTASHTLTDGELCSLDNLSSNDSNSSSSSSMWQHKCYLK
jgi:hypothetical protein